MRSFLRFRRFMHVGIAITGIVLAIIFLKVRWSQPEFGAARAIQTLPALSLAGPSVSPSTVSPSTAAATIESSTVDEIVYLPIISKYYNAQLSTRIGFGATTSPITRYPEVRRLNAGWYVDWGVNKKPIRPAGMDYVQMVRVHQNIVTTNGCGVYVTADREKCPYVKPYSYSYAPDANTIQAAAKANPGSTWLIGNEPDRLDWNGFGQDEMLPELYAVAYKELHDMIKAADPAAKIAVAGIIQATPMRLDYLSKVWTTYQDLYKTDMPVDIWNVHNFILSESCRRETINGQKELICYGSGVVPGSQSLAGSYVDEDWRHIDRNIFDDQIRAFRKWMRDRGQVGKPLIVTEYGILYKDVGCPKPIEGGCGEKGWPNLQDPQVVQEFMMWSFDYFLNTKDCALSGVDDCRLVQQWLWFSLDHEDASSNRLGNLVDRSSRALLPAGQKFKEFTDANHEALSVGY